MIAEIIYFYPLNGFAKENMLQWFKLREENGKREVFDPVRRKYVLLTPEEEVRQIVLQQLVEDFGYPAGLLSVEFPLRLNGLDKRCDIVVFSRQLTPLMIVECKARHIQLSQKVLDQTMRYNVTLNVKYLLLTNGQTQYSIQLEEEGKKVVFLDKIPEYNMLTV
jgi:hypothetical protein